MKINRTQNINKRIAVVRRQRMLLCITGFFIILFAVLCLSGSAGKVQAENTHKKYYTQIQVGEGDTVWNIAARYITSEYQNTGAYIDEVAQINHISVDEITSGCYLMIPYYAEAPLDNTTP